VLDLGQHVGRHEHRAALDAGLPRHGAELLLEQRVQPAGGLVQDEQLRVAHERPHQADLLLVALGQPTDRPPEVQPLGQHVDASTGDPTAQVAEEREQLPAGLPAFQA
jgi:hypothetical protein